MDLSAESPPRYRVTVRDVARLAGVSAMTVSRALNTPERVQPPTLARIQAAVEATQYVPNLVAGSLRTRKSRVVAAIVPAMTSPVFSDTVNALSAQLEAGGYHLMLGQSGYCLDGEESVLQAFLARRPDGLVLIGVDHSRGARAALLSCGVPVMETWDYSEEPIDLLVGFSHANVGAKVCGYLLSKGRRHLAVVSGTDARAKRRADAFAACASARGLSTVQLQAEAPTTLGSGRKALQQLLQNHRSVDGMFCSSDMLALGVLIEAASQNISVPGQLSVIGFGDLSFAADTHPALTTVKVDGARIGSEAAKRVMQQIERPAAIPPLPLDVGFSIVERHSA